MIRSLFSDFLKYLKKHNIIAFAVSFMIAKNISKLTTSAVDNVFNPMLDPLIQKINKEVELKTWRVQAGPFDIGIGDFLSDLLEFLILGIIIVSMTRMATKLFG